MVISEKILEIGEMLYICTEYTYCIYALDYLLFRVHALSKTEKLYFFECKIYIYRIYNFYLLS